MFIRPCINTKPQNASEKFSIPGCDVLLDQQNTKIREAEKSYFAAKMSQ